MVGWEAYELFKIGEQGRLHRGKDQYADSEQIRIRREMPLLPSFQSAHPAKLEKKSSLISSMWWLPLPLMGEPTEWQDGNSHDWQVGGLSIRSEWAALLTMDIWPGISKLTSRV